MVTCGFEIEALLTDVVHFSDVSTRADSPGSASNSRSTAIGMLFVSIEIVSFKSFVPLEIGFLLLGLGCGDGARSFGGDLTDAAGAIGSGGITGSDGSIGSMGILLPGTGGGQMNSSDAGVDSAIGSGGHGGAGGVAAGGTGGNSSGGRMGTGGARTGGSGAPTGGTAGTATGGAGGRTNDGSGGASPGTGGAKAPGSGGTTVPGTGGAKVMGSGGATVMGTGGATMMGTGGAQGTGGATVMGTGGAPATARECQQYKDEYETAVQNDKSCKDNGAKACETLVPAKLTGCGSECGTFVNKPAMLEQIREKWTQAGCVAEPCLISICVPPIASSCSVLTGQCTDNALGL